VFYEDVEEGTEIYFRGAFFSSGKNDVNPVIDFFVLDPERKVIFSRRKRAEGVFKFNSTIPG
jgi:hypothetical protein